MTNIIGPHGTGINETTTRPTDTASGNPVDTWFQPCINGDPNTGTKIPAVWLNKVTALLRRAIRGMSVPENELDDDMLLKAIRQTMPLLVNSTAKLAEISLSDQTHGALSAANPINQSLNVDVNVTSLTTSPILRNGFAMVTVTSRILLDDCLELTRSARIFNRVFNAGREILVGFGEIDAYASGSVEDDYRETGSATASACTILVPLSNGAGQFQLNMTSSINLGSVTGWESVFAAYLDGIFPRSTG